MRDRATAKGAEKIRFRSALIPPYLRKSKSVEELLPWLYLKGISTGDFSEALAALLGPDAEGLSASTITRLKATWWEEYQIWRKRDLTAKRYVYIWADGVYFSPRLDDDRQCMLVIIGTPLVVCKQTTAGRRTNMVTSMFWASWTDSGRTRIAGVIFCAASKNGG